MNEKIINEMKAVMKIHADDGNWNYDSYSHGCYNGMEMMLAIAEDIEPIFRAAPTVWLEDSVTYSDPVASTN